MNVARVFILEDIAETRDWLCDLVAQAYGSPRIDTAATLRESREKLNNGYDLALIDLGLPDGSGLDILRAMKARDPAPLCVVTTVMGDDGTVVSALSAGSPPIW